MNIFSICIYLTYERLIFSGSLAAHQVLQQSVQPFPKYRIGMCTCACADTLHLTFAKAEANGSESTQRQRK